MPALVAIGYPDETTAGAAADEARSIADDLGIEPEAIAAVTRARDGGYQVSTNHHAVSAGAAWGMFWGLLFGVLLLVPVFGTADGAGLRALMGKVASGIDRRFQDQVRDMLRPGTSALFLVVETVKPDTVVERLQRFGGTVLESSLSREQEQELRSALHGEHAPSAAPVV